MDKNGRTIIMMDDRYDGRCVLTDVDAGRGIGAYLALSDNHVVAYSFNGRGWTEDRGRSWIKNRKRNDIVHRTHADGTAFVNTILLSSKVKATFSGKSAEEMIGAEAYERVMAIEQQHNSHKPFIVEIAAMDFKGKETLVANELKFNREEVNKDIAGFTHIPIHLGHIGVFQDYQNPVGNTVASYVDADGNPAAFSYIYPHGEAGQHRTNLQLAAAQGEEMLSKYPVSMRGTPTKYTLVEQDDEKLKAGEDFVYAEVHAWTKKALDFVDEPAIPGSAPRQIVNSRDINTTTGKKYAGWKGDKKVEITFSEALALLKTMETIAISDLLSAPAVKAAVDSHVEVELSSQRRQLVNDPEFQAEVLAAIDPEKLEENERVKEIANSAVTKRDEAIAERKGWIPTLIANKEIKLSKGQVQHVELGITGEETEEEILERMKTALELSDLEDVDNFSLSSDNKLFESSNGAEAREATQDEINNRHQP